MSQEIFPFGAYAYFRKEKTLQNIFIDSRFFFLAESLSDFGLTIRTKQNSNRAVARVKKYSANFSVQKSTYMFLLIPCNVRQNRIVRFPSKDKIFSKEFFLNHEKCSPLKRLPFFKIFVRTHTLPVPCGIICTNLY